MSRLLLVVLLVLVLPLLIFALWWVSQKPSHQRDWADDVGQLLRWEQQGSVVTLHNVRHFDWRSETDFTPLWETRQYNLDSLESADLVLSYWMGPHIAHTLVSFGFADGRHLVFSLEIRKERGEAFSAVAGFFRQYESVLIAADEDDIIKTRTNARGEDVYLYRLAIPREQLRTLFMAYLEKARDIEQRPQFYNTLTSNCTTIVVDIARHIAPGLPMDYRLLASGHFAEYAFDQGGLVGGYDFETLHRLGRITKRAQTVSPGDNFSNRIREGIPIHAP